ncbi:MAG: PTS sugar transporter subunit IIA [Coriobacteriia bacterium]|nr:PTS sugar transporter subunit IIA [Coriobacteriia bacterium]
MVGVIIATHGQFAEGLVDTAKMFADNISNIKVLPLNTSTSLDDYFDETMEAIEEVDEGDGVIALVDILGGTPSTTLFRAKNKFHKNVKIVTGLNLPMMVALLTELEENTNMDDLAKSLVEAGTLHISIME